MCRILRLRVPGDLFKEATPALPGCFTLIGLGIPEAAKPLKDLKRCPCKIWSGLPCWAPKSKVAGGEVPRQVTVSPVRWAWPQILFLGSGQCQLPCIFHPGTVPGHTQGPRISSHHWGTWARPRSFTLPGDPGQYLLPLWSGCSSSRGPR